MKTIEQILQGEECALNDKYTLEQAKSAMKEYATLVLKEAASKATIILKDCYSEDYAIKEDTIVRWHSNETNNSYPDDMCLYDVKVNQDSILNIIKRLK